MAKYIGDILDGEKYTDKQTGEEKIAWKNYGGLFYNEETSKYSVKIMGKFFNVFPKKENTQAKAKKENDDFVSIEDIAF